MYCTKFVEKFKRKGKPQKETMPRGAHWQEWEDLILVESFICASENSVVGTDQKESKLYETVQAKFEASCKVKGKQCNRNSVAMKNRWLYLQKMCIAFNGRFDAIKNLNKSGSSEDDIYGQARIEFERIERKPFGHYSVWAYMRNKGKLAHVNRPSIRKSLVEKEKENLPESQTVDVAAGDSTVATSSTSIIPNSQKYQAPSRPTGRDTAKAQKRKRRDAYADMLEAKKRAYDKIASETEDRKKLERLKIILQFADEEMRRKVLSDLVIETMKLGTKKDSVGSRPPLRNLENQKLPEADDLGSEPSRPPVPDVASLEQGKDFDEEKEQS